MSVAWPESEQSPTLPAGPCTDQNTPGVSGYGRFHPFHKFVLREQPHLGGSDFTVFE